VGQLAKRKDIDGGVISDATKLPSEKYRTEKGVEATGETISTPHRVSKVHGRYR